MTADYRGLVTKDWIKKAAEEILELWADRCLTFNVKSVAEVIARNVQPSPDKLSAKEFWPKFWNRSRPREYAPGGKGVSLDENICKFAEAYAAEARPVQPSPDAGSPVPIYLTCPKCGMVHVDEGEWATRPHKTHQCQECFHEWRPFPYATVGIPAEARPVQQPDSKLRQAVELFLTRCGTANATDFVLAINDLKGAL